MAKSGKSGGSGKSGAPATNNPAPGTDYDLQVGGEFKGKIRDVEVGAITGDVTQANTAFQLAANASAGGAGSQQNLQSVTQINDIVTDGEASLDITVTGDFKGQIRDIEVGLITGDIIQTNIAFEAAANVSAGKAGSGSQLNQQLLGQANLIEAIGDIDLNMVVKGQFKGQIRDIEVGLITADVTQTNTAVQLAANVSRGGGGAQANDQSAFQVNHLAAIADIEITLVFEGDFKGQVRDITIGVVTGDISQSNTAIQVGLNVSGRRGDFAQSNTQLITQTNTIDADGGLHVFLHVDSSHKGDFRDLDISLTVDNVLQSNEAAQIAVNGAASDIWG